MCIYAYKLYIYTVVSETQFILVLSCNYCILFQTNNCKPTFATT